MPEIDLPWRRTQVLALHVFYPSSSRPHFLARDGAAQGVFVRLGSTNRRADAEMIEELRRFARGEGFNEQPVPGLNSEALDFRAASELFAADRKLDRRDLETLRLVTDHQGKKVPTVGGMILFGRGSGSAFPGRLDPGGLLAPLPGERGPGYKTKGFVINPRHFVPWRPCPRYRSTPASGPSGAAASFGRAI